MAEKGNRQLERVLEVEKWCPRWIEVTKAVMMMSCSWCLVIESFNETWGEVLEKGGYSNDFEKSFFVLIQDIGCYQVPIPVDWEGGCS